MWRALAGHDDLFHQWNIEEKQAAGWWKQYETNIVEKSESMLLRQSYLMFLMAESIYILTMKICKLPVVLAGQWGAS